MPERTHIPTQSWRPDPPETAIADPVGQTIETIAALHTRSEQQVDRHQRAIETFTAMLGRPGFLYFSLGVVLLWITANIVGRRLGMHVWDPPPFYWLQGGVGLSALLVTTVVLITQNRQGKNAQRRAQLDLQMSLLAEQKMTKMIQLLEELRHDLPIVQDREDPEARAMTEAADPSAVLTALEVTLNHGDVIAELGAAQEDLAKQIPG